MSTLYINSSITDAITQTCSPYGITIPASWSTPTSLLNCSFTKFEDEIDGGYKIVACIPGCLKENVSVKYVSGENIINLEAESKVEHFERKYEAKYYIPKKFNLDEVQCSLKNGVLVIFIPHGKNSKPKEVKII